MSFQVLFGYRSPLPSPERLLAPGLNNVNVSGPRNSSLKLPSAVLVVISECLCGLRPSKSYFSLPGVLHSALLTEYSLVSKAYYVLKAVLAG